MLYAKEERGGKEQKLIYNSNKGGMLSMIRVQSSASQWEIYRDSDEERYTWKSIQGRDVVVPQKQAKNCLE